MSKKINNPYIAAIKTYQDIIYPLYGEETPADLDLFQFKQETVIDLGCGAGNFLRDYARQFPEKEFIGFELRFKRLVKGAIKLQKHNITNVKLVRERAEEIRKWVADNSLSEVHINFPDPWAKTKQRKHRLINAEYLKTIHAVLKPGGSFSFKTDHQEYFHSAAALLKQQSDLEIIEFTENLHESPLNAVNIPTEFEQLFRGKGKPVYFLKTIAQ